MKTNPVKRKLHEGRPSFGTWLTLGSLHAARVLARLGFDWLTLDIEHSAIDWSQAATIFAAVADGGCVPLARVPRGTVDHIKRVLDAGAWGVVVPMVDSVEQAQQAVAAAKYPPVGCRSVGGGMHSLNFDATAEEYYRQANDEILVVLQAESPTGVAAAEAICRLPGVDAVFVGPNDLRAQMRRPDGADPTPEEHEAMLRRVVEAGKKAGTPTGIHTMDARSASARAEQGFQMIAVNTELEMLVEKAQEIVGELKIENWELGIEQS